MHAVRLAASRHIASAAVSRRAAVTPRAFHATATADALAKFAMPAMSPTMTEGGISSWKKKEGESFTAGDVLLEIETDKATMDVEAQEDGILAKIIVQDGAKGVPVGKAIAVTAEEGDDLSGADKLAEEAPSEQKEAPKEEKKEEAPPAPKEEPKAEAPKAAEPAPAQEEPSGPRERVFASPIARKIAQEKGIPLAQIKGSGPGGRIIKVDVENYKAPAAAPSAGAPAAAAGAPAPPKPADTEYTDIPLTNMRKVIAQRLSESKQQLPHYYVTSEVELDKLLKLREVFNASAADKSAKLSVNDFIVKAVALALAEVPEANQAWLGDVIRQYKKADISVAVATPNGLITPIIKDAGSKGLAAISAETKALAAKARDGKLKPEEYQGGTFTISNLGMFNVDQFTAIINPPQSCILAVGTAKAKLVLDAASEKGFKEIQTVKLTLSSDHRVVDGAVAARFLQSLSGYLSNPLTFML